MPSPTNFRTREVLCGGFHQHPNTGRTTGLAARVQAGFHRAASSKHASRLVPEAPPDLSLLNEVQPQRSKSRSGQ